MENNEIFICLFLLLSSLLKMHLWHKSCDCQLRHHALFRLSFTTLYRKTIHQRDDMNTDEKVGMIIISWYPPTAHKKKDFISHHKYEQWTACSLQVPTRGKALQGWTRPSIDELGVPTESWAKVHRNLLNVARNFVSLIHLFVQMNSKHKGTTSLGTSWELFA